MIVAKYKFNPSTYADYLPIFNTDFTSYTKSDITNSDGTITRTIESSSLPTLMTFGTGDETYTRSGSLLEILDMNTSNLTSMQRMFRYCINLTNITCNWNTSKVTTMRDAFRKCTSLTSLNLSSLDTSKVTDMTSMFNGSSNLTSLDLNNWDTSKVTNMVAMFLDCSSLTSLSIGDWNTSNVTNLNSTFKNCSSLVSLDLNNWDTSKITDMQFLFCDCTSLIQLNISNWDTSRVTNMGAMFQNCSSLTTLDLNNWNTSKVTNLSNTFKECKALTQLDINDWNTSKVTTMTETFKTCLSLTSLDLSNWDTSNVTQMSTTFRECKVLTQLNISNWDVSKLNSTYAMFHSCFLLESLDLSNWNTVKLNNSQYMFGGCSALKSLDLSNWNTDKISNMTYMFQDTPSLYKVNLKYANQSTVSKINEVLFDRTNTTKGYILSSVDLTLTKNWQIIKSSHNNFYLPQPLNKIGDVKDRLYWDENKGHYCIEQNTSFKVFTNITFTGGTANDDGTFVGWGNFNIDGDYDWRIKPIINHNNKHIKEIFLYSRGSHTEINISIKDCTSLDDANIKLNEDLPLTVLFAKSTPNIIDLPHLNQKLTFDSYNPSTTIDIPNRPLKASKTYLDAPIARYRYTNLQPSTQYNVQFDCKGDAAIKVNLGGTEVTFTPTSEWTRKNLTITTPSELVNDKLSISNVGITSNNRVDNVMLFSEVIVQEPDYIDGIQNIGELQDNGTYKIDVCTRQNNVVFEESDILETYNDIYTTHSLLVQLPADKFNTVSYLFNEVSGLEACINMYDYYVLSNNGKIWVNVGNKTDITSEDIVIILNDNLISRKQSIYLPRPLRKKGNAKDRFYWDDNKGHYCIEQNVGDNLEVLSSPDIIDLTEMNQKFSFDTYLPNTYVDVANLPLQPYKLQLEDDTVRYKSTIEPSTLYTIQFNCVSKLTTRLTLDLGGTRKTVDPTIGVNHVQMTTPSVLASDRLFLIGTGIVIKEVIVNKGDMRQYPMYFDGEHSVGELQTDGSYKIVIKTNEGFTVTIRTSSPLTKLDKIYWNDTEKRYEIDRNRVIEVPTVEGDIINLPRLYQKVDTIVDISTDNIEPSKIDISYKDIH